MSELVKSLKSNPDEFRKMYGVPEPCQSLLLSQYAKEEGVGDEQHYFYKRCPEAISKVSSFEQKHIQDGCISFGALTM